MGEGRGGGAKGFWKKYKFKPHFFYDGLPKCMVVLSKDLNNFFKVKYILSKEPVFCETIATNFKGDKSHMGQFCQDRNLP